MARAWLASVYCVKLTIRLPVMGRPICCYRLRVHFNTVSLHIHHRQHTHHSPAARIAPLKMLRIQLNKLQSLLNKTRHWLNSNKVQNVFCICVCNYSAQGSSSSEGNIDAEFQQRVAALQDSLVSPDLQAIREAADSKAVSRCKPQVNLLQQQQTIPETAQQPGTSSSSSQQPIPLWSKQYGYAVLGGVHPEASQQEAGAQQPKLHPTRDFRQGEMYAPTDLSPLSKEEPEAWLPRIKPGSRHHKVPRAAVKQQLDYKNVDFLLKFVSDSGRLKPRRVTGLTPVLQARVSRTVKMARQMALLPYEMRVGNGDEGDRWKIVRQFKAEQRGQQDMP